MKKDGIRDLKTAWNEVGKITYDIQSQAKADIKQTSSSIDRRKVLNVVSKATSIGRKLFDIYNSVHKKDPVSVGLALLSTYQVVEEAIPVERNSEWFLEKEELYQLPKMTQALETQFVFELLRKNLSFEKVWDDDLENGFSFGKFNLYGLNVFFSKTKLEKIPWGPFIKKNQLKELEEKLSRLIEEKIGKVIGIEEFRFDSSYGGTSVKIVPMEINDDGYVVCFDQKKLDREVLELNMQVKNRSFLFYGTPGTGKTIAAYQLSKSIKGKLLILDSISIGYIRTIFDFVVRIVNPKVILFDDVDRFDKLEKYLTEIEQLNTKINGSPRVIIGTANNINKIPNALLRPGRLDRLVCFYPPNADQRMEILKSYFAEFKVDIDGKEEYINRLANVMDGLTGAYIKEIARRISIFGFEDIEKDVGQMCEIKKNLKEE